MEGATAVTLRSCVTAGDGQRLPQGAKGGTPSQTKAGRIAKRKRGEFMVRDLGRKARSSRSESGVKLTVGEAYGVKASTRIH